MREVFLGCNSKDEQTVLTVLIIYRCGEVCFQFRCYMNWTQEKEGIEESCALVIVERGTICHVQICTITNEDKKAYSIRIMVSWVSSGTQDRKRKPSRRDVGTGNEKKLTARWHMETSGRERQKLCFAS